jgi:predicted esterase
MRPEAASPHQRPAETARHGRLTVRLVRSAAAGQPTGLLPLEGIADVPGIVYVPGQAGRDGYRLVLLLHGAGGSARHTLDLLLPRAHEHRLLLLAPQSTASTWDLIVDGYGADVERIDRALQAVQTTYPVADMIVGGFSDGASYALSLGLTNGDVFNAVVAYSPGFTAPLLTHGQPAVFVSHGTADRVLPINACSRRLVPRLRTAGYRVTYEEFDGGHEVPEPIVERTMAWLPPRQQPGTPTE